MLANVTSRRLSPQTPDQRVLIVEDEFLIALDVADTVEAMGLQVAGLATGRSHALELAQTADIAFVDVNLADGRTGPELGRQLAEEYGVTVIYMTANPEEVERIDTGPLGVLTKPVMPHVVEQSIDYAVASRKGTIAAVPRELRVFSHAH
ncbi:DNA-binding response OmpR family regulator [Pseudorhizobium tarimense]|uniref:DNA-binding response OmpR family regulator n=1 Tax=Pseudorhizobium tarimense TaxID=1079109 RepID=A0ABV2H7Y9_9HYPH|nr:response regulator [Pseudorhizobium tarimense]MCJ8519910.1 response regulator [Pseudorhizobium tarimense]